MNQIKIGSFIKRLRKEKGLTQEQFAEQFNVSRRTVSRWETGSNLPDLSILVEMAAYCNVDLRELLEGEKKGEKMDKELEETVMKVVEYSNEEKNRISKKVNILLIIGVIVFTGYIILTYTGIYTGISDTSVVGKLANIMLGLSYGVMTVGALYTSGYLIKIKNLKKKISRKLKWGGREE